MGSPSSIIQPMHKVRNTAAHLILRAPPHQNCTPLLQQLYWLSITEWIKYKSACMCYDKITGSAPSYFSELLHLYSPSHSLHTSSDRHAQTPTLQPQNPWLSHFLTLWPPYLEQSPPRHQALVLLSLPSKANSRHFSSQNISVKQNCPSPLSVCTVCACVCMCVCVCVCECVWGYLIV